MPTPQTAQRPGGRLAHRFVTEMGWAIPTQFSYKKRSQAGCGKDAKDLLVDDDMAVAATVVEGLVAAGFQVVHAAHTSEALDRLDADLSVDLCLVDLVMPQGEPDGLSFARTVNRRDPRLPVILLTGYYGFVARAGELPAKLLYKPIDLDVLVAEVRDALSV